MNLIIAERHALFIANAMCLTAIFLRRRLLRFRRVQMRHHREHARRHLRRLGVDRENFSFRDVALDGPAVRAIRHLEFNRVFRRAGDFRATVNAIPSRSEDVRRFCHSLGHRCDCAERAHDCALRQFDFK